MTEKVHPTHISVYKSHMPIVYERPTIDHIYHHIINHQNNDSGISYKFPIEYTTTNITLDNGDRKSSKRYVQHQETHCDISWGKQKFQLHLSRANTFKLLE